MQNIASDLFLLTTHLSQLKNRDKIVQLFIDSIPRIFTGYSFKWNYECEKNDEFCLPVSTLIKTYGFIQYDSIFQSKKKKFALFKNTTQLIAIILERLEQHELLNNQKIHLQLMVDKQTNHLIEKKDELNEMNEAFATLNEELIETNKSLQKLNEQLHIEIEERAKLEESIAESEAHFRTLADSGQALIWTSGIDKKCNYFNQPWLNFTGRTIEQEIGDGWIEGVHPDDLNHCIEIYVNAFNLREKFSMEYRILHAKGEYRWIQDDGSPRYNSKGEFIGYIGHCLDINEHKNIEEEIKKRETQFRSIVHSSPNGIYFYTLSPSNQLIFAGANPAADKIIGIDHQALIGKPLQEVFPNLANTFVPELYTKIAKGEIETNNFEITYDDQQVHGNYQVTAYQSNESTVVVEFNDISERKLAEKELEYSHNRLEEAQTIAKIGNWEANLITGELYWSEEIFNIFGLNSKSFSPSVNAFHESVHPDDREKVLESERKSEQTGFHNVVHRIIRPTGEIRFVHELAKRHTDDKGNLIMLQGTVQDVTERKLVEIKLRDSERLLNESQRISGIGSYVLDINLGIWTGSEYLNEMFGIDATDDHSVESWLSVIHPDDKAIMSTHLINDILSKKGRFDKEYRIIAKNTKKERWVHEVGELEFDTNDNPIKMIGTIRDNSDRKKADEELRKLLRAVEQSPDSIIITNQKGDIEYANPAIIKLTGFSNEELIGKNPRIFSSGENTKEDYKILWDTIGSGNVWQGEFHNKKKNGELYWESATISPVFDTSGKITHYLIISEDITEKKELTQELIEAKERAEESDRLKSSFLANMSHEIRTPMNSIMGFASLLPEEESKELMRQYANIIVQNSEQLVSLIDGIVMYSKLQTGLFMYRPTSFLVQNLFTEIIQSFNLPIFQKGITLKFVNDISETTKIYSDYDKLRQVISNMIVNALKYTPKGEITLGCTYKDEMFEFYVKDTGIGIPPKDLPHIFERFYRGSNIEEAISRGTGLGLCIVKELVEMLGGKIWVESVAGKGSTFYFTIPYNNSILEIQSIN